MKTIKTLLLCGLLAVLLSVPAFAETKTGECGDSATWTLTDDGTLTIDGSGEMWNYTYQYWRDYQYDIEKVIIQGGITRIGEDAFRGLVSLTDVIIGDSISSIGIDAFYGCNSLENVTIGSDATNIASGAFYECYSLKTINFPDSLTTIGDYAFYSCYELSDIQLGNQIKNIGNSVFAECYSIKSIVFPDTVKHIGNGCFYKSGIENITFGSGISIIPEEIFRYCDDVKAIIIPSTVKVIENLASYSEWKATPSVYYAGTKSQWDTIRGDGKEILEQSAAHIYFNSTGPDDIGDEDPVNVALFTPAFGATIPITVSGNGTRTVNFLTAFYDTTGRFIGLESINKPVYPGLSSIFLPITRWSFVPTMRAFALDDTYRPLSPAGQAETGGNALPDKYADILSESDEDARSAMIDALTETEAKDFVKVFAGWVR